jgi:FkbM family methyltransferase
MHIAFIDLSGIDFTPLTPEEAPLGGMQSGLCYLSQALQRRGHSITLLNGTTSDGNYAGVRVVNFRRAIDSREFHAHDAFVSISSEGKLLRTLVGRKPLILYTGHNSKERSIQVLHAPEERESWDYFVFKSNWQAETLRETFSLNDRKIRIVTNAVAPFFHDAPKRTSYFFSERRAPVLYFSSTPFRGLKVLCEAFPLIARAIPGVHARIFSSMKPYHCLANDSVHGSLYEACRRAGMEYVGSLDQRLLVTEVRRADVLAFPSTYPETSCITIMEAMASSALVVTRALGAIPETSAGFAHLMPAAFPRGGPHLPHRYADFLVAAIRECNASPRQTAARLELQHRYSAVNYDWVRKAEEWEALLQEATGNQGRTALTPFETHRLASGPAVYNYVQTVHGKRIYIDPRDARAKRLIAAGGSFNPETISLWQAALRLAAWDVIIDVGANYGEMLVEPGVEKCPHVLAIEPNPAIIPYLSKTVAGAHNVTIVSRAIADAEGERRFAVHPKWSGMSRLGDGADSIIVKTTTIDSLLSAHLGQKAGQADSFDGMKLLLKVDVEGSEPDVLQGASRAITESVDFCCLIEISHLNPENLSLLDRQFQVYAFHRGTRRIERVAGIDKVQNEAFGYWHQDVILRRRDEPRGNTAEFAA